MVRQKAPASANGDHKSDMAQIARCHTIAWAGAIATLIHAESHQKDKIMKIISHLDSDQLD